MNTDPGSFGTCNLQFYFVYCTLITHKYIIQVIFFQRLYCYGVILHNALMNSIVFGCICPAHVLVHGTAPPNGQFRHWNGLRPRTRVAVIGSLVSPASLPGVTGKLRGMQTAIPHWTQV